MTSTQANTARDQKFRDSFFFLGERKEFWSSQQTASRLRKCCFSHSSSLRYDQITFLIYFIAFRKVSSKSTMPWPVPKEMEVGLGVNPYFSQNLLTIGMVSF